MMKKWGAVGKKIAIEAGAIEDKNKNKKTAFSFADIGEVVVLKARSNFFDHENSRVLLNDAGTSVWSMKDNDFCAKFSWLLPTQDLPTQIESLKRTLVAVDVACKEYHQNRTALVANQGFLVVLDLMLKLEEDEREATIAALKMLNTFVSSGLRTDFYTRELISIGMVTVILHILEHSWSRGHSQDDRKTPRKDAVDWAALCLMRMLLAAPQDMFPVLFKGGAIRNFIKCISRRPHLDGAYFCLHMLTKIIEEYPGFLDVLKKVRGLDPIIASLGKCGNKSRVAEEACSILLRYTVFKSGIKSVMASGASPALVDLLHSENLSDHALILALQVVRRLAEHSASIRFRLRDDGAVDIIIFHLGIEWNAHHKYEETPLSLEAVRALASLCRGNAAIRVAIRKAKGIQVLAKMIQAEGGPHQVESAFWALVALQDLTFASEENRAILSNLDLVPLLVQILDTEEHARAQGEGNLELATKAAELLNSLSIHDPKNKTLLTKLGAIPAFVHLLKDSSAQAEGVETSLAASTALLSISVGNPGYELKIREAGGPCRKQTVKGALLPGESLPSVKLQSTEAMATTLIRTQRRGRTNPEKLAHLHAKYV